MAEALQHRQTALSAWLSTAGATDNEPVPDTTRSGRANAIVSKPRWYKKSVRPLALNSCRHRSVCNVENPWKRPIIAANILKLLGSNSLGKGEVHSSILCGSTTV